MMTDNYTNYTDNYLKVVVGLPGIKPVHFFFDSTSEFSERRALEEARKLCEQLQRELRWKYQPRMVVWRRTALTAGLQEVGEGGRCSAFLERGAS